MIGNTLYHHKVLEKIGQSGMGEVYLAKDSRLDRKVAIKILPQHFSERAALRDRIQHRKNIHPSAKAKPSGTSRGAVPRADFNAKDDSTGRPTCPPPSSPHRLPWSFPFRLSPVRFCAGWSARSDGVWYGAQAKVSHGPVEV